MLTQPFVDLAPKITSSFYMVGMIFLLHIDMFLLSSYRKKLKFLVYNLSVCLK